MLKKILLLLLSLSLLNCSGTTSPPKTTEEIIKSPTETSESVENERIVWNELTSGLIAQAAKDHKELLLFFNLKDCKVCEAMLSSTFKNPEVVNRINKKFICVLINADEEPSLLWMSDGIYPTVIFFSDKDVYKAQGYASAKTMLQFLDEIDKNR